MFECIVIDVTGGKNRGLGKHTFHQKPSMGEHICIGDGDGETLFCEVIAVLHGHHQMTPGVDLVVRQSETPAKIIRIPASAE